MTPTEKALAVNVISNLDADVLAKASYVTLKLASDEQWESMSEARKANWQKLAGRLRARIIVELSRME